MSAGSHIPFVGSARVDVHDAMEEIGLTMLATEVTTDDVLMVGEVGLAMLAAVDLVAVEIGIVRQSHDCKSRGDEWARARRRVW